MDDGMELLDSAPDNQTERECPECAGTCYDADDAPCRLCYGEGLIVSY
jgi:DnaJ-class molecular chaperone